ncbi:hypothetical protein NDU88_006193 [Pleurodeles waltl]|uniref:Uncharacterized protein n=1 Tax=Pleurodeles waltl TaxID=8319 RepID=A0AAV7SP35_PLEWA|nr:hypothetical protein NDU88_006193 [Pleurodeles waltl]
MRLSCNAYSHRKLSRLPIAILNRWRAFEKRDLKGQSPFCSDDRACSNQDFLGFLLARSSERGLSARLKLRFFQYTPGGAEIIPTELCSRRNRGLAGSVWGQKKNRCVYPAKLRVAVNGRPQLFTYQDLAHKFCDSLSSNSAERKTVSDGEDCGALSDND